MVDHLDDDTGPLPIVPAGATALSAAPTTPAPPAAVPASTQRATAPRLGGWLPWSAPTEAPDPVTEALDRYDDDGSRGAQPAGESGVAINPRTGDALESDAALLESDAALPQPDVALRQPDAAPLEPVGLVEDPEPAGESPGQAQEGDPAAVATGGRHAREPRGRGRPLVVAGGAVAAVTVGIVAMNVAAGSDAQTTGGSPTVQAAAVVPSLREHPESASPSDVAGVTGGGGIVTPASADSHRAGAAGAGRPSAAAVPPTSLPPPRPPVVAAGAPSVTVLNQTGVKGLGATQASRLAAAGWQVRRVTDVRARVSMTTVYYDQSQAVAARGLVATVPTVRRALPRPRWLLRTGGLIVVVARDAT